MVCSTVTIFAPESNDRLCIIATCNLLSSFCWCHAGHGYDVRDVAVSGDNSKCAAWLPCYTVLWLLSRCLDCTCLRASSSIIKAACRFASCGGDRQVFLWDVSTGRTIRKFRGHDGVVNSVSFFLALIPLLSNTHSISTFLVPSSSNSLDTTKASSLGEACDSSSRVTCGLSQAAHSLSERAQPSSVKTQGDRLYPINLDFCSCAWALGRTRW